MKIRQSKIDNDSVIRASCEWTTIVEREIKIPLRADLFSKSYRFTWHCRD